MANQLIHWLAATQRMQKKGLPHIFPCCFIHQSLGTSQPAIMRDNMRQKPIRKQTGIMPDGTILIEGEEVDPDELAHNPDEDRKVAAILNYVEKRRQGFQQHWITSKEFVRIIRHRLEDPFD